MPSASRNANRKRRIRRNITLLNHALKGEALDKTKALIHLMSVLAQKGGEVTVTKGTIDQVVSDLRKLSYSVDKGETENEFVFRLVVATEMPEAPKPVDPIIEAGLDAFDKHIEDQIFEESINPRVAGDDDGVEYSDPRDERDERDRTADDHIGEAGE